MTRSHREAGGEPAQWGPANETEQALVEAVARGDQREYYQLLAAGELYLPVPAGGQDRSGPQRLITIELLGQQYLPVFTSVPTLALVMMGRAAGYTLTNYSELRRKWPAPQWRLAINPGTPIDAYVTIEAVQEAALGQLTVPTGAQLIAEAAELAGRTGAGGSDAELRAAASRADVDGYVRALLDADVVVPTAEPVEAERIREPGFPWCPVEVDGSAVVEVFSSVATLLQSGRDQIQAVTVPFAGVLLGWPDETYGLVVDPGTPLEVTVSGEHLQTLVLWLPEADDPTAQPVPPPSG